MRTPASLPELTRAAAEGGVVFAGAVGGGYVFPEFLPGYDAVASLAKLLELLAPVNRPLSELVAELPEPTLVHHQVPCPWALKGLVMRVLNERLAGRELDLTDGIKVFDERGWVAGAAGSRRAAPPSLRRGRDARRRRRSSRASCGRSSRRSSRARPPRPEPEPRLCSVRTQRLKFSFTLRAKGPRWNRCPISRR